MGQNKKTNKMNCIYLNSNSITANKGEIERMMEMETPSILLCAETHITANITDAEIEIKEYNHTRCNSFSRHTGGVIIYTHKTVDFKVIYNQETYNNMWCTIIKTKKLKKNWQIGVIYHSPNTSDADFIRFANEILDTYINEGDNNVIVGDFNINENIQSTYTNQLNQMFAALSMAQLIKFNTRITETTQTKIDLLYSNSDEIEICNLTKYKISDHETIQFKLPVQKPYKMRYYENRKCWDKYSKENLINNLRTYNFGEINQYDVGTKVKLINNILNEIMETLTYDKIIQIKLMNKWYDRELSQLNKLKYELKIDAERYNEWDYYNCIKRKYKTKVKKKKIQYMENKITTNYKDKKLMWKCLKDAVNMNNTIPKIKGINVKGTYIENEYEIASELNQYFVDSIISIRNSIENSIPEEENEEINRDKFEFKHINTDDIKKITTNMKNKYGGRKLITEGVIKDSAEYLGYIYTCIINESLTLGVFPESWKLTTIVPVEKVKGTKKPEEIRPINTLPSDEKIIETVVKNQLQEYLNRHEIIIEEQSGFRSKHSCETALNLVISEWKESMSKKQITVAVFIDLKRAFETIDRDILLKKLNRTGVRNTALEWFRSYLTGRKQRTIIGNAMSNEIDVNIGLPQGSVLAAILFTIYINDINKCMKFSRIRLFADDALLTISCYTLDEAISKIQTDLNLIYQWLCQNKLKTNVEKTKWMLITKKSISINNITLKISNTDIHRVNQIKYLGIIIDDKLKFDEHLKYIDAKLSTKIGFMYRSCRGINRKYKIMVYRSTIEPHFMYCPTILYTLPNSQISKLQKKQNKAMRFVLKREYDTPIQELLDSLNWLSVKQLTIFHTMKFIHNAKLGNMPNYLNDRMRYNREIHRYETRNMNSYHLPIVRTESDKRNIFYEGIKEYNELPNIIKNCNNFVNFKKLLFTHCRALPIL